MTRPIRCLACDRHLTVEMYFHPSHGCVRSDGPFPVVEQRESVGGPPGRPTPAPSNGGVA